MSFVCVTRQWENRPIPASLPCFGQGNPGLGLWILLSKPDRVAWKVDPRVDELEHLSLALELLMKHPAARKAFGTTAGTLSPRRRLAGTRRTVLL